MNVDTWLFYVGTVLLLMSTRGPGHVVMLSVGICSNFRRSLATAAGCLCANEIQIEPAGLGLAAVVTSSQ